MPSQKPLPACEKESTLTQGYEDIHIKDTIVHDCTSEKVNSGIGSSMAFVKARFEDPKARHTSQDSESWKQKSSFTYKSASTRLNQPGRGNKSQRSEQKYKFGPKTKKRTSWATDCWKQAQRRMYTEGGLWTEWKQVCRGAGHNTCLLMQRVSSHSVALYPCLLSRPLGAVAPLVRADRPSCLLFFALGCSSLISTKGP